MSCNAECRCRKGIIALVFVPGIMGTRLKNNDETGKSVWDPAAGLFFTFKGEPSSTQAEMREWQKAELLAAQPDDDDGILESTGKFIHRGLIQAREFNPFYQVAFGTAEVARKTRTFFSSFSTLSDLFFAGPLERKALLVNSETEEDGDPIINGNDDLLDVDEGTDDYFRVFTSVPRSQMELKRKRGWGEVLWDNYGPLLKYLEDQESSLRKDYPGIRFPVFAVGYNWMLSNEVSGQRLNLKLAEFKKALLDEDKEGDNFGYTQGDIKFVIITHSMGGFVARSSFLSAHNKDIAGVIHGAMPTHGSPSTYYQFRSGAVGHGLKGQAIRQVLGKNAADMTAVMGYCQGGLELLPNQLYVDSQNRSEWLFLQSAENGPRQSIGNAYDNKVYDFYRNFAPWYRLVQPELLAPELQRASDSELKNHRKAFTQRVDKCEVFHQHLAANFHINTALIYSNNPNTKAFEHCEWQLKGELTEGLVSDKDAVESWQQYTDQNHKLLFSKGEVKLMSTSELSAHQRKVAAWRKQIENTPYQSGYAATPLIPVTSRFRLAKETAKGDGTVHEGAGEYPKEVLSLEVEADKEHQEFYNCFKVREEMMETLTSWLPEIHKGIKG